jgi:hypothetical protein
MQIVRDQWTDGACVALSFKTARAARRDYVTLASYAGHGWVESHFATFFRLAINGLGAAWMVILFRTARFVSFLQIVGDLGNIPWGHVVNVARRIDQRITSAGG